MVTGSEPVVTEINNLKARSHGAKKIFAFNFENCIKLNITARFELRNLMFRREKVKQMELNIIETVRPHVDLLHFPCISRSIPAFMWFAIIKSNEYYSNTDQNVNVTEFVLY